MPYTEGKDFMRICVYTYKKLGGCVGIMKPRKRPSQVRINLTLSPEDKRWVKVYAAEHDMTVSNVLRQYIHDLQKKEKECGIDDAE